MKRVRLLVGVLLVLLMLGSVVSPTLAVNVEQKTPACPSCSEAVTGKSKIVVIEAKGIERNTILAKALKSEDMRKIMDELTKKGYTLNLSSAKIGKIITQNRIAEVAVIPMKSKQGEVRLIYVSVNGTVKVRAVEAIEKSDPKQIIVYRIENGKIESYALQIKGEGCTETCGLICGMSSATICLILCAVVADNPACDIGCSIVMGGICGAVCDQWCTGNINPCDAGCGAFCSGMCAGVCIGITKWLGVPELTYFCEKYACSPACTGVCEVIC